MFRGKLPWTRLLLPALVVVLLVGFAVGEALWPVRVGLLVALEIAFVVVAIRVFVRRDASERAEVAIARALEALVPPAIARLAAVEMTLVGMAVRFVAGGWRRRVPEGVTYHRESGLRLMLPIIPLLAVGDILLLELVVLPRAAMWVRVVVHVLAAYGLVWMIGLYAAMRERPHRVVDGRLELYRGVLRSHVVEVAQIESIAAMPEFGDDWKKRAYLKGTVRMAVGGGTTLVITMRDGTRIVVGVDDPAAFRAAVTSAAANTSAA
ncbi:MAG: hypothetical protein ACKV2T_04525 [Kofleriaceae bacterium]